MKSALLLATALTSSAALSQSPNVLDRPIQNQTTTVPRSAVVYGPTGSNAKPQQQITQSVAVTSTVAAPSDANTHGYIYANNYLAESTAALAASATYNTSGTGRDAGTSPAVWSNFRCFFLTDQPGNGFIQQSSDGTNWRTVAGVAGNITANNSLLLTSPVMARYSRCSETNTSTSAQTVNTVWSGFAR